MWHSRIRKQVANQGQRGLALIIAILMLVGLTGLALSTMTSSGIDYIAARANAGTLGRISCIDQVARFAFEQIYADEIEAAIDGINNGTCQSAGVAWVNFTAPNGPIPAGDDGTNCILPVPSCGPKNVQLTQLQYGGPAEGYEEKCDGCGCTRAIAVVAPTPYNPGGNLVGESVGQSNKSSDRRVGIRIVVADMPKCEMRYLNHYIDVAAIESFSVGAGAGDVAQ